MSGFNRSISDTVVGSCGHSSESSGSMKGGQFRNKLADNQFIKNYCWMGLVRFCMLFANVFKRVNSDKHYV